MRDCTRDMPLRQALLWGGVWLMLVPSLIRAQQPRPLKLEEVLALTLKEEYGIRIARLQDSVVNVQNSWAAAEAYPTVSLSIADNHSLSWLHTVPPPQTVPDEAVEQLLFTPALTVGWNLTHLAVSGINKHRLELLERQTKGNSQVLIENTIVQAITLFYTILLNQELLLVTENLEKLSLDRYQQQQDKRKLGVVNSYEVLQSKETWLANRSKRLRQQIVVKNALRDLGLLMGVAPQLPITIEGEITIPDWNRSFTELEREMLNGNRSLQTAVLGQQLSQITLEAYKAARYPDVRLQATLSQPLLSNQLFGYGSLTSNRTVFSAGLNITFDIYRGGSKRRAIQVAHLQQQIQDVNTDKLKHSLQIQLRKLYDNYILERELYELALQRMETAETNLGLMQDRYRAGSVNSLDMRNVQIFYEQAATEKLQAAHNMIVTYVSIQRLAGTLLSGNIAQGITP